MTGGVASPCALRAEQRATGLGAVMKAAQEPEQAEPEQFADEDGVLIEDVPDGAA